MALDEIMGQGLRQQIYLGGEAFVQRMQSRGYVQGVIP